jgi:hypothetical protein
MSVILALFVGLTTAQIAVSDRCEEALHALLTQEGLELFESNVLERDILVYTLGDGDDTTGILGCRLDRPVR